jgi:hypothetical protein
MIVMTALKPLRVIISLPFGTKIMKIGGKVLEYWSANEKFCSLRGFER